MKDYLKHVPGFRSDTKWKKILASFVYFIFIFAIFSEGLEGLLMFGGLILLGIAIIDLINNKKSHVSLKVPLILLVIGLTLSITGANVSSQNEIKAKEAEKLKLVQEQKIADEKEAEIKEQERIKLEEEAAKAKIEEEKRLEEEAKKAEEERIEKEKKAELAKNFTSAKVTKHVDGDTVHVTLDDGQVLKIRMIGVDTPETVHPSKPVQFYGKEASNFTQENIFGKTVYLEKDVSEADRYGRSLRYIWMEIPEEINKETIKTKMFNGMLVAQGFANSSTYQPDVKYQDYFLEFEREAREQNIGLWDGTKANEYEIANNKVVEKPAPTKTPTTNTTNSNNNPSTPTPAKVVETPAPATNTEQVLVTPTGSKYHKRKCGNGNFSQSTLANAKARGLEPCSKCY